MEHEESLAEIEAAYQRAMMVVDATETLLAPDATTDPAYPDEESDGATQAPVSEPPTDDEPPTEAAPVLRPREILEAALFVGGQALTTKRLAQMLGSEHSAQRIDTYVEELNETYRQEQRPYRIDFGEGGYRLNLLLEYEPVRRAVFGTAPNEVKLSQEALEVLALVAYRQPARQEELEEAGPKRYPAVLRQLLRRQLLSLDRTDDGRVTYSTTPRFLEVFGLRSLDDLPLPDDIELK